MPQTSHIMQIPIPPSSLFFIFLFLESSLLLHLSFSKRSCASMLVALFFLFFFLFKFPSTCWSNKSNLFGYAIFSVNSKSTHEDRKPCVFSLFIAVSFYAAHGYSWNVLENNGPFLDLANLQHHIQDLLLLLFPRKPGLTLGTFYVFSLSHTPWGLSHDFLCLFLVSQTYLQDWGITSNGWTHKRGTLCYGLGLCLRR